MPTHRPIPAHHQIPTYRRSSIAAVAVPTSPRRSRLALTLTGSRIALGLEVAAVALLLIVAAAVRADGFMVVPRLADETLEVVLGLRLAREGGLPLVGVQPYTGSLFTYLVAASFLLAGPKIEAGRLVVLTTGVLTILPTYLLGRGLGQSLWGSVARGRLVGLIAALMLSLSGPHTVTSSRIAYSNSLTPLFTMIGLWLAHRAISRRSDWALVGCGAAFGLALQTHVTALAVIPGVAVAILLPAVSTAIRGSYASAWPRLDLLLAAAGAGILMLLNILAYNLIVGPATVSRTGLRIGRYVTEPGAASPWTLDAWADRLLGLLQAAALAVGSQTSEVESTADALLAPAVIISVALALLGIWVAARRGHWLPLFVTVSVVLIVSLLNGRVEPIVPRVRHYATLVPLGMVMIAVGLAWLYEKNMSVLRASLGGAWIARVGLAVVPLLLVASSMTSYAAYEAERLSRPEKNNAAYLAVLDAVSRSGPPDERLYLDYALTDLLTMSGGRMITHLRYAFSVSGQEFDTIQVDDTRLPIGQRGDTSRRLILNAQSVAAAASRYRLVPLPGEPGEGAPLRAFRAFPLRGR
jgi:4-amino-4-deoxy-L-arabinose transferase-like glycosyltransferase